MRGQVIWDIRTSQKLCSHDSDKGCCISKMQRVTEEQWKPDEFCASSKGLTVRLLFDDGQRPSFQQPFGDGCMFTGPVIEAVGQLILHTEIKPRFRMAPWPPVCGFAGDGWVGVKSSPRRHAAAEISECFLRQQRLPRATLSRWPI